VESKDDWSVYLETKNPNKAVGTLDNEGEFFVAGAQNYFALTKVTDNGKDVVDQPADLYIDNVVIRDADGKAIPVDTTVKFDKPAGFGEEDWSNLTKVKDEVELEGFNVAAAAWAQAGVKTVTSGGTFDVSLLKPGTILTINYTAPEGNVWLVAVPAEGATFGWTRIQQQTAVKNDSNSVCQITYEQLVEALGTEDLSGLDQLQAEGDVEWSVSKVTIGVESVQLPATMGDVEIEGFQVAAAGWAQAGVKTTEDGGTFDASLLKPGCIVTIKYKSAGPVWLVAVPGDGASYAWTRIAQGAAAKNADNTECQITYDQIVTALGTEDFAAGLAQLQAEGEQDWEVYSVSIGYPAE
jgi:hypothetical protein